MLSALWGSSADTAFVPQWAPWNGHGGLVPAKLFLHPFRVLTNGAVGCANQGSDIYLASQVLVIVGTRLGEREMCLPYGIPDPAFAHLAAADVQSCADRFGPDDLRIDRVDTTMLDDLNTRAIITWSRQSAAVAR